MEMNGRETVWSCERRSVKESGLKEGVCCNEALSVEMLKRFQRYPVGDCEVRWKRNVTKGCDNNTSRP
jgi:hypothetical protein